MGVPLLNATVCRLACKCSSSKQSAASTSAEGLITPAATRPRPGQAVKVVLLYLLRALLFSSFPPLIQCCCASSNGSQSARQASCRHRRDVRPGAKLIGGGVCACGIKALDTSEEALMKQTGTRRSSEENPAPAHLKGLVTHQTPPTLLANPFSCVLAWW